jgi:hypothetical protein
MMFSFKKCLAVMMMFFPATAER